MLSSNRTTVQLMLSKDVSSTTASFNTPFITTTNVVSSVKPTTNLNIEAPFLKNNSDIIENTTKITTSISNNPTLHSNTTNIDNDNLIPSPYYKWIELNSMSDVLIFSCSVAVIFGGILPYIPQYLKIQRTLNNDGFSTYVCLTLLIANILRILFWFGHKFETPLLLQSFVMIAMMLAMIEVCVRVHRKDHVWRKPKRFALFGKRDSCESTPIYSVPSSSLRSPPATARATLNRHQPLSATSRVNSIDSEFEGGFDNQNTSASVTDSYESLSDIRLSITRSLLSLKFTGFRDFWQWDDLFSYVKFLSLFTLLLVIITYIFVNNSLYVEVLGYLALLIESMLGMPQLVRNYRKKSTRGMSLLMVLLWLTGDVLKTVYFVLRQSPTQFWVCGSIQVVTDLLIILQVLVYKKSSSFSDFA